MNSLNNNYHDAILESITYDQRTLELSFSLYAIYYPAKPQVKILLKSIKNSITCEKWVTKVIAAFQEENEASLGARINDIYVDKNNKNKLIIAVDSMKPVKLNFEYFKEILNPTTCS